MNTEITSSKPAQRPWARRLAELSAEADQSVWPPRPLQVLLETPFPTILLGAAVYTEQPCLLQNTRLLLDAALDGDEAKLRTDCCQLLHLLRRIGCSRESEFFSLLSRLLVEPFARMNQCEASHSAPAPSPSADNRMIGK